MVGIANTLLAMGKRAEARRWIDRVARCRPTGWTICIGLSVLYERLGQLDKSIRWAVETARLSPNNPAVSGRLAQVYFAAGEFEKAAEACEKTIPLFSPDTLHLGIHVYFILGESHRHLGNKRRACAARRALAHPQLSSADRQTMERLLARLLAPPRRPRRKP